MTKSKIKNPYSNFNLDLSKYKFLGKGHNGSVYLMPDGKVVKICIKPKSCLKEYLILKKVKGSTYFPAAYFLCGNLMIRDYVAGENLKKYIKRRGLSHETALELIKMLEEFKRLGFKKKDIRCKDIYIQKDGRLMIIDPKGSLWREVNYPRHLCKGLEKLSVLNYFLTVLKEERPKLYKDWYPKLKRYFDNRTL